MKRAKTRAQTLHRKNKRLKILLESSNFHALANSCTLVFSSRISSLVSKLKFCHPLLKTITTHFSFPSWSHVRKPEMVTENLILNDVLLHSTKTVLKGLTLNSYRATQLLYKHCKSNKIIKATCVFYLWYPPMQLYILLI